LETFEKQLGRNYFDQYFENDDSIIYTLTRKKSFKELDKETFCALNNNKREEAYLLISNLVEAEQVGYFSNKVYSIDRNLQINKDNGSELAVIIKISDYHFETDKNFFLKYRNFNFKYFDFYLHEHNSMEDLRYKFLTAFVSKTESECFNSTKNIDDMTLLTKKMGELKAKAKLSINQPTTNNQGRTGFTSLLRKKPTLSSKNKRSSSLTRKRKMNKRRTTTKK